MDIDSKKYPRIEKGFQWLEKEDGRNFLSKDEHAPTRDIFEARLNRMRMELAKRKEFQNTYQLITAFAGEFGNNSFDHNLGNWRDEPGVFFVYDSEKNFFVVADRGQGVRQTLRDIRPDLPNDAEAIRVAFTEIISGRSPEHRGNGLKFVRRAVKGNSTFRLFFYSGRGEYQIVESKDFDGLGEKDYKGTIAILFFS